MNETTTRIRWEPTRYGGWTGHVGNLEPWAYQIWQVDGPDSPWRLDSALLGQFGYRVDHPDPEVLKPHAERWLEEFVSSLGAIFPASLRAGLQAERDTQDQLAADHAESGHDWAAERAYGRVEALDRMMAELARIGQDAAPAAAGEKE